MCETYTNVKVEVKSAVWKLDCAVQDFQSKWEKLIENAVMGETKKVATTTRSLGVQREGRGILRGMGSMGT